MNSQKQIDRLTTERASEWLEVLRNGKTDEYPEFVRWIGESPRHLQELMALLVLVEELPGAFARASIDRDALLNRIRSPRANVSELDDKTLTSQPGPKKHEAGKKSWKIAAVAATVSLGGALLWWATLHSASEKFSTAIGEQRTVALADGSLMSLNAHSTALVKFTNQGRDIQLLEGEALFDVARDRERPFRVRTQDATVQVIGTRFNVDARPMRTIVSVLDGKVEVSADVESGRSQAQPLGAGEAAEISREGALQRRAADATGVTAWRQRQLVFSKTSLEDVAADFNRFHQQGRMVLEGIPSRLAPLHRHL